MPVLNSSPYELVKKGLLSLYVTRLSHNTPDSLMNLCNVEQLRLPLITLQVVVPVGHNSHPCCLRANVTLPLIHFPLCHIVKRAAVCVYACVSVNMIKRRRSNRAISEREGCTIAPPLSSCFSVSLGGL